ncbi:hypothetical protein TcWFU_002503 [Taenia crassiceps]|uniref:Uncharacterized protein n=1 Tax=Taenia crassiceps TaxID=6207 RepID=A0ABR4Q205_9CEST
MRTSATLAILLVCAIAQSQAFFSLLDSELLSDRERYPSGTVGREAEGSVEAEAAGEHQGAGEVAEPAEVTQRDISLLRRDIVISLERLRRTLDRHFSFRPMQPFNLRYPGELGPRSQYLPTGEH